MADDSARGRGLYVHLVLLRCNLRVYSRLSEYSTVDMPSSSTTSNINRAQIVRILFSTTIVSFHLLSAVTEFRTAERHRPARRPPGRCPDRRMPVGSRVPA